MPSQTYLTDNLPGIGGELKIHPDDFFVEEIPLYQPIGEGQHTYIEIEKRGIPTYQAINQIAQAVGVSPKGIGYAGLKDAQAVTRQMLSLDQVSPVKVAELDLANITIRSVNLHRNKLKIGHLKGNRFIIRVREVNEAALPQAEAILNFLAEKGVPNFFGEQRFGTRHNTHRLGEAVVRQNQAEFVAEYLGRPQPQELPDIQQARQLVDQGEWEAALSQWPVNILREERKLLATIVQAGGNIGDIFRWLSKKLRNFFVSAFQSHLFNILLNHRLTTLDRFETGDVAYLHHNGACFIVESATVEQPRADTFEISPTGPLFGPKMLLAQGEPGQREMALLADYQLTVEDFKLPGLKLRGERRPYRFKLAHPKLWWDEGLMVSFELPPGAYATTVMGEVMKSA